MPQPRTALIGVPLTMLQNAVHCTPVKGAVGAVSPAAATIEFSMSLDPPDWVAVTPSAEGIFSVPYPFMRCTDAPGATVIFKW